MSITIDKLKRLLDAQGVRYFQDPHHPAVLMNFGGLFGSYQVVMQVDLDGKFLLIRTLGYARCPASHPHSTTVLQVLGALDYQMRTTKWGWDPSDGEIVACVDLWLEDAVVTESQFQAILRVFLPAIDMAHQRITTAMATGVDPKMPTAPPPPPPPPPATPARASDEFEIV